MHHVTQILQLLVEVELGIGVQQEGLGVELVGGQGDFGGDAQEQFREFGVGEGFGLGGGVVV